MPSTTLNGIHIVEPMDVLGELESKAPYGIVIHVGLNFDRCSPNYGQAVEVHQIAHRKRFKSYMVVHVAGRHPRADAEHRERSANWIERNSHHFRGETKVRHFVVLPIQTELSENLTERPKLCCTSLVTSLYRFVDRQDLIDIQSCPSLQAETITNIYALEETLFGEIGLTEATKNPSTGGWKILLGGYLIHALHTDCSKAYVVRSFEQDYRFP